MNISLWLQDLLIPLGYRETAEQLQRRLVLARFKAIDAYHLEEATREKLDFILSLGNEGPLDFPSLENPQ